MNLPEERVATRVKICGLTNLADVEAAVDAGADLIGFNFYDKSPRYISPDRVAEIVAALHRNASNAGDPFPAFVGVFVNTHAAHVAAILVGVHLDYAQLHGDESPGDVAQLAGRAFKALRPTTVAEAIEQAARFAPYPAPQAPQVLIDAYVPSAYGGTGQVAEWAIAARVSAYCPRLMLAGGLTPETVSDAIRQVHPWGVDVSSGVEATPGQKDHKKLRDFIAAVRSA
jgi:phosphoribosylanthranilate isomerase